MNVSVWDSDEHAAQMGRLKEMTVDARGEMEAVGVTFIPIIKELRPVLVKGAEVMDQIFG
jgi:hypothetical protein